jgi:hypothetical protein
MDPMMAPAYTAGTTTNLFAAPGGSKSIDGWLVHLPADWTLHQAVVLRYGAEQVAAEVHRTDAPAGQYAVVLAQPQQGPHEVVLRAEVGPAAGRTSWSIVPFTYEPMGYYSVREAQRVTKEISVKPARALAFEAGTSSANRALALNESGPVLLRPDRLPRLRATSDFTVEFWIQTTGLEEVILSTWSGDENESYALEVMIDASGRLRYYCGRQGRHESLTTRAPLADGRWHHVAIVHRAEQERIILLREGQPVDSLQNVELPAAAPSRFAVGGRAVPDAPSNSSANPSMAYSGRLDELRFWPTARPASTIRFTARRTLSPAEQDLGIQFRFEEEPPPETLAEPWPDTARRVPSDLSLNAPLQHLSATVGDEAVRLHWEATNPVVEAFIVERSAEGAAFEPVGRVRPAPNAPGSQSNTPRYEFADPKVEGQVVYYRIRQRFADGTEQVSGTLKIGLGASDRRDASLIGNFPNPFSETTTIAYEVRETQPLQLTVWDLSGQRITTLADDTHPPGYYEQPFQADNLPSGTYFVRLKTPRSMASHRMVLLK